MIKLCLSFSLLSAFIWIITYDKNKILSIEKPRLNFSLVNLKNLTKKECYHIKSTLKYIITLDNIINTPYFKYLNNYCKLIIITI